MEHKQFFMNPGWTIDASFPGGNISVDEINNDDVVLRQDFRDSKGGWFYWAFQVRGAEGQRLTFHFAGGDVLGMRGPAVSDDNGASWRWLGDEVVSREDPQDVTFAYDFPAQQTKVLFAFCPVYTEQDLYRFLRQFEGNTNLRKEVLCRSRNGKEVDFLRIGNPSAKTQLVLTCRHHACEATASYFLEGILEAFLREDEIGSWLRANVDCAVVPFMDKDGVEKGDQGKNRAPHDHNRDYMGEPADSIYPEVAALRQWMTTGASKKKSCIALDLHCPHIRGVENDTVYFVGQPNQQIWQEVNALSAIWERLPSVSIPFEKSNNIPFGETWNTDKNFVDGKSFTWWASELSNVRLAAAMEMPYASASDAAVTPASYRELGRSLAEALRLYLQGTVETPNVVA